MATLNVSPTVTWLIVALFLLAIAAWTAVIGYSFIQTGHPPAWMHAVGAALVIAGESTAFKI